MNSIREKKEARRFTSVPILNRVKYVLEKGFASRGGSREGRSLQMKYRELREGGGATDPSNFLQGQIDKY